MPRNGRRAPGLRGRAPWVRDPLRSDPCAAPSSRWCAPLPGRRPLVRIGFVDIDMVIGGQPGRKMESARLRAACAKASRLSWHHFVEDIPGGIMFEDQTVDLLPARTTLQAGAGGAGGRGGRGGDALAVSAAVIFVGGDVDDSTLTATAGDAPAGPGGGVRRRAG